MLKNKDYWIWEWKPKRNKSTPSHILTAIVTTVRSAKAVITTFCKMFSCQKNKQINSEFFLDYFLSLWYLVPKNNASTSPNPLGTPPPKCCKRSKREQFREQVHARLCRCLQDANKTHLINENYFIALNYVNFEKIYCNFV